MIGRIAMTLLGALGGVVLGVGLSILRGIKPEDESKTTLDSIRHIRSICIKSKYLNGGDCSKDCPLSHNGNCLVKSSDPNDWKINVEYEWED